MQQTALLLRIDTVHCSLTVEDGYGIVIWYSRV